jgi:RNA polymerase sigma-70 factor (ECF subfamily)
MARVDDVSWESLRRLLVDQYDHLRNRLARRLGSADLASEALHEVYLRLGRTDDPGPIANPAAYLFRSAYNLASDMRRMEERHSRRAIVDGLETLVDQAPGPDGIAESKLELEALSEALLLLPRRQRAILIEARYSRTPQAEIARRHNISKRLVQRELQRAHESCKELVDGKNG